MELQGLVRFSYAVLIRQISSNRHAPMYLSLLNRGSVKTGAAVYKSLGGGGELTSLGMQFLVREFNATSFEDGNDARFQVEAQYIQQVMSFFASQDSRYFEIDPRREMREELLGKELPGQVAPILSETQLNAITTTTCEPIRLAPAAEFNSARDSGMRTFRFFSRHDAFMPDEVFETIASSIYCRLLSEADIDKGITSDGCKIGGNVIK